jgi:hypothetical protein
MVMKTCIALMIFCVLTVPLLGSDCPTPLVQDYWGWQHGYSVHYYYPTPGPPPGNLTFLPISSLGIADDISAAFSQWEYANERQNSSGVIFFYNQYMPVHNVYAYRVNFPGIPFLDPMRTAYTYIGVYSGTPYVAVAATEIYYDARHPIYTDRVLMDPAAPNFHTFITKVMRHEIGHAMGLGEQPFPQVPGQSVMNAQDGTNDSANNMPAPALGIPSCDNLAIDSK